MAERGKHKYAIVSSGSNSNVKSGAGTLYGITVSNANGGTLLVDDSAGGIGATPNYNADTSNPIGRFGTFAATPSLIAFAGIGFNDGLTVAASSNARLTIEYE